MKAPEVTVLFLLIFLEILCDPQDRQNRKRPLFDRFDGGCELRGPIAMFVKLNGAEMVGTKAFLNMTVNVTEDIPAETIFTIDMVRCANKENLDTCEPYYKLKNDHYCSLLSASAGIWKPTFSAFQPPLKCPMRKNVYAAVNSTVDGAAFLPYAIERWFWRVKIQLDDKVTKKRLMSLCVYYKART